MSLVDRLIDVKAAQANLDALESQWRLTIERMRNAQDAIQIQQQAGLLTRLSYTSDAAVKLNCGCRAGRRITTTQYT